MSAKIIDLPDIGTLHLHKRRGTKSIRLSISHNGQIRVSMPPWVPYRLGIEFAIKKRQWLKDKQKQPTILKTGHRIGRDHELVFTAGAPHTSIATRITKAGEIRVNLPAGVGHDDKAAQTAAERASIRALKREAEQTLPSRLYNLARQHGFSYRSVSIKRLSSRWGSCSDQQNIALNCYLVQLPNDLIDYVLLHELLHTKIMAHGSTFWSELSRFVPDLASQRKRIRQYKPVLMPQ